MLNFRKAEMEDCLQIHAMQVKSFQPLFDKYNDVQTNPAAESVERITQRMKQDFTDYYFIQLQDTIIGAIRIVRTGSNSCRISPMFILPQFQGNGYAQETLSSVEKLYANATVWTLDTIKQENKLCHLYEKMGYKRTGKEEKIKDGMDIVFYAK